MAYIIGLATAKEIKELKRRGWKIEKPPKELVDYEASERLIGGRVSRINHNVKFIQVYVDSNLFDIMNGPDWDYGEESSPVTCKIEGNHCLRFIPKYEAHRHDGKWVCNNCWDERLRNTE